jgi:hypothetical protein
MMMIPITVGRVRYIMERIPRVASVGSLDDIYIEDNIENNPIIILLNVTISAGENSGDGIWMVMVITFVWIVGGELCCMSGEVLVSFGVWMILMKLGGLRFYRRRGMSSWICHHRFRLLCQSLNITFDNGI